jgi:hypothetical protein
MCKNGEDGTKCPALARVKSLSDRTFRIEEIHLKLRTGFTVCSANEKASSKKPGCRTNQRYRVHAAAMYFSAFSKQEGPRT